MEDLGKSDLDEMDDESQVVVMTDEEGKEYYYREDMIIPIDDKRFSILVPIDIEEDCECTDTGCDCCGEDADAVIARIDTDDDGEDVYVDPTDEEYEQVIKAYDEIIAEEDAEAE
jgi:uncharacterized protein YrzB (UPF0473 family)